MKYIDLKEGGYYIAWEEGGDTWNLKIKEISGNDVKCHVNFTLDDFYGPEDDYWSSEGNKWEYREATYSEALWIEKCLQAGEVVEFEEFLNETYEIY